MGTYDYLMQSPIRQVVDQQEQDLSIFETKGLSEEEMSLHVRDIVTDVKRVLDSVDQRRNEKLKVAVLGELKAGKSTFINACIGQKIAYTDMLEATAAVSEICYSGEEYARLIDKGGQIEEEMDIEELVELMEEKAEDEDFSYFQELDRVEIGVDSELVRNLTLVDTPGLLSITTENQHITSQYVYQADYIIWVINCNNLGDKKVNDKIREIKRMGKPMIGVVNRVDTKEMLDEIKDYVEKQYRGVFEELFFLSAKKAWNGRIRDDDEMMEASGIEEILDYLADLGEDAQETKADCNEITECYQLRRERDVHDKILENIKVRKNYYDSEMSTIIDMNRRIRDSIKEELKYWLNHELYLKEKTDLINTSGEKCLELYEKYTSSEYITALLNEKYVQMGEKICKEWQITSKQWMMQPTQVELDFQYVKRPEAFKNAGGSRRESGIRGESIVDGIKKGAGVGVVFAGISAWLGPAAAYTTIGAALGTWLIPCAITGAIVKGIAFRPKTSISPEQVKEKEDEAEHLQKEVVNGVKGEVLKLKGELEAVTDYYCDAFCKQMKESTGELNFSFEQEDFDAFVGSMQAYFACIEEKLKSNYMYQPGEISNPDAVVGR